MTEKEARGRLHSTILARRRRQSVTGRLVVEGSVLALFTLQSIVVTSDGRGVCVVAACCRPRRNGCRGTLRSPMLATVAAVSLGDMS